MGGFQHIRIEIAPVQVPVHPTILQEGKIHNLCVNPDAMDINSCPGGQREIGADVIIPVITPEWLAAAHQTWLLSLYHLNQRHPLRILPQCS